MSFQHPISGVSIETHGLQFVDDTTQFLNCIPNSMLPSDIIRNRDTLIEKANHNAQLWSDLLWISGGHL